MDYTKLTATLQGISPLVMHNAQLADPFNKFTLAIKAINKKAAKTEADLIERQHLEFLGGLYVDDKSEPCVPGENIEAMLVDSGKKLIRGIGSQIKAGLFGELTYPLIYKGPRKPEEMWKSGNFHFIRIVTIKRDKIQRCRPIFNQWSVDILLNINEEIINPEEVRKLLVFAGRQVGLMDWIPKYGRFEVKF